MNWREIQLGDAIHVKHGFAFKGEHFSHDGTYLVLTPGNFNEEGGFRLRPGKDRFYTGDIPEDYILSEGDLIVAMTEQGPGLLGSSALIPEDDKYLHNQRLGLIRDVDDSRLNKNFLYYLFNTRSVRGQIKGSASGTKVRHTAPERIYRIRALVPSEIAEQRKIASILSAYDDLIENNRRRIQLLEQAARLLYKEWFVHLRFPGHEHVKIIDGVPEGWNEGIISDFYFTASGGTPSRKNPDFFTGDIPWVKTQELTGGFILGSEEKITEDAIKSSSAKFFPRHTVLVAMYGATIGQTAILSVPSTTNQASCALIPRAHGANYAHVYLFLMHHKTDLVGLGQGAAQNNISQKVIKAFKMILPTKALLDAFSESACPIFEQIEALQRTNVGLTQARDILLPRLMNGEITV
ncbi:MAG: restriction endonuclease subunit S [Deltaproteobacteria bacterium]|nr:restriction endonuclease subunit S [Deltaproteobacteria bacterium]